MFSPIYGFLSINPVPRARSRCHGQKIKAGGIAAGEGGGMPKGAQQSDPRGRGVTKGWGTPGPLPRHPDTRGSSAHANTYTCVCVYIDVCEHKHQKSKNNF